MWKNAESYSMFQWVMDEADVAIDPKAKTLNFARVNYKISNYDLNAIEEAAALAENMAEMCQALHAGTPLIRNGLKNALSRGLENGILCWRSSLEDLDALQTSNCWLHL